MLKKEDFSGQMAILPPDKLNLLIDKINTLEHQVHKLTTNEVIDTPETHAEHFSIGAFIDRITDNQLLTLKDVGRLLGLKPNTISCWFYPNRRPSNIKKMIPFIRDGRRQVIPRDDFVKWYNEHYKKVKMGA